VVESAASSTFRVPNHWPDKHQSQAMITLFQIVNCSPFMPYIVRSENTDASLDVLMVLLVLHCILESTGSNIYPKAFNSDKFFFLLFCSVPPCKYQVQYPREMTSPAFFVTYCLTIHNVCLQHFV